MTALDLFNLIYVADAYKTGGLPLMRKVRGIWTPETIVALRGSTATRVNKSRLIQSAIVSQPLIDFTGGGCPAWLFQKNSANLLAYSEQFDNAYWAKVDATVTPNVITAPDGNLTADKLVEAATTSDHYITFPIGAMVSANTYTLSVFAKKNERDILWVYIFNGTDTAFAFFNVNTGQKLSVTSGATSDIEDYGDGYYRCSITRTITGDANANGGYGIAAADNVIIYAGNGVSGLYIWGAQLEPGSYATTYTPTTTTSEVRSVDTQNGIDVTGCFDGLRGTFCFEITKALGDAPNTPIITMQGSGNDAFQVLVNGGTPDTAGYISVFADIELTNYNPVGKWAVVCDELGTTVYRNGVQIVTPAMNPIPVTPLTMIREASGCVSALRSFAFSQIPFSADLVNRFWS